MRRSLPDDERTVVTISSPADILGVLPHRMGFHPSESIVVVCLEGPRRRDLLVMRQDLAEVRHDDAVAADLASRAAYVGSSAAVLVCYTSAADDGHGLARSALIDVMVDRFAESDIGVIEALLVRGGRWWSYLCTDHGCCPPAGSLVPTVPTAAASAYAAESVVSGGAVLEDRVTLERSIEPSDHAVERAVRAQAAEAAGHTLRAAVARGGPGADRELTISVLRRLVGRWAGGSRDLPAEEAALVVVGLRDTLARDEAMTMVLDGEGGVDPGGAVLLALLSQLARRADCEFAAPVCTVLAWAAYAQGAGALTLVAAERALRCEPDYTMAQLMLDGLARMVPPAAIRAVSRQVLADLRHPGSAVAPAVEPAPRWREGRGDRRAGGPRSLSVRSARRRQAGSQMTTDAADGDRGLVEPEGVDAESAAVDTGERGAGLAADRGEALGDVRSGGRADLAGQAEEVPTGAEELLGPPAQDGGEPGQELSAGEG